jgi:hypothetical protein
LLSLMTKVAEPLVKAWTAVNTVVNVREPHVGSHGSPNTVCDRPGEGAGHCA